MLKGLAKYAGIAAACAVMAGCDNGTNTETSSVARKNRYEEKIEKRAELERQLAKLDKEMESGGYFPNYSAHKVFKKSSDLSFLEKVDFALPRRVKTSDGRIIHYWEDGGRDGSFYRNPMILIENPYLPRMQGELREVFRRTTGSFANTDGNINNADDVADFYVMANVGQDDSDFIVQIVGDDLYRKIHDDFKVKAKRSLPEELSGLRDSRRITELNWVRKKGVNMKVVGVERFPRIIYSSPLTSPGVHFIINTDNALREKPLYSISVCQPFDIPPMEGESLMDLKKDPNGTHKRIMKYLKGCRKY